ncbi:NAD(P)-binding protein [Obba rivulosa]|uniref:NAD(P)-binding protein n=1 Tax=Obba rivulosa TaxID=1052685 RepID=A0A8E2DFM8_9APHY|nr:NAD(P)-binding protein [Obba rivulosa]
MTGTPLVWFITGASSGLGRELVQILLDRGDCVIATARSLDKIHDLPQSDNIRLLQLDVTDGAAAIRSQVEEAATYFGRIDVLVNNAGVGVKGFIEEGGSTLIGEQFAVNVLGQIDVTQAVLPHMRAQRSGTVVFMGSRSSWSPENISTGIYAASKGALRILGETLAQEVAPFSIRVLIVEPGLVKTNVFNYPFYKDNPIIDYDEMRKIAEDMYGKVPLLNDPKKVMQTVADVVRGEGKARGRPWPLYLPLTPEAETSVRNKCAKMAEVMEEWKDVIRDTRLEEAS